MLRYFHSPQGCVFVCERETAWSGDKGLSDGVTTGNPNNSWRWYNCFPDSIYVCERHSSGAGFQSFLLQLVHPFLSPHPGQVCSLSRTTWCSLRNNQAAELRGHLHTFDTIVTKIPLHLDTSLHKDDKTVKMTMQQMRLAASCSHRVEQCVLPKLFF